MNDNDNEKPFITDNGDMIVTIIILVLMVTASVAISLFSVYELWRFAVYLLG